MAMEVNRAICDGNRISDPSFLACTRQPQPRSATIRDIWVTLPDVAVAPQLKSTKPIKVRADADP